MEKPQAAKYQEKLNEINSTGLAKKFIWVFIQYLTKTQINFSANTTFDGSLQRCKGLCQVNTGTKGNFQRFLLSKFYRDIQNSNNKFRDRNNIWRRKRLQFN